MELLDGITLQQIALVFGVCAAGALMAAVVLLISAAQQVSQINVPEDADFFETLQMIPITVPLALDLLDMVFDIFAAPISWIVLELLGLKALQTITVFEGVIPGTQLIPTMTASWIVARLMKDRRREDSRLRQEIYDHRLRAEDERYERMRSGRAQELQNRYRSQPLLPSSSRSQNRQKPAASYPPRGVIDGEYEEFIDEFDDPPPEVFDDDDF